MSLGIYWLKTAQEHGQTAERLRAAAAIHLGAATDDGRLFCARKDEKPYFPLLPQLHCSVSHSGGIWLCALSSAPVGVDLQRHEDTRREKIARRFFHKDEIAYFEQNGYGDFFRLWAAKESYVKYTGQGLLPGFDSFSAVKSGEIAGDINGVRLLEVPFLPDFSLFVCGGEGEPKIIEMVE